MAGFVGLRQRPVLFGVAICSRTQLESICCQADRILANPRNNTVNCNMLFKKKFDDISKICECYRVALVYKDHAEIEFTQGSTMTLKNKSSREAFHFAKLALTNVRLLGDLEKARATSTEIQSIVNKRMQNDSLLPPFSLLHQATFLQFSYICLVWLWEQSKQDKTNDKIANLAGERFCFSSLMERVDGPRKVRNNREILRLMRNAISHGHVVVEETGFVFKDKGGGEG